jgi:hypothetical protein
VYTYLTPTLFFSNNKKKYLTPSHEYRAIDCYLKYNKALYKLFKILIKFIIKYGISPKDTEISPKNTNTSLINL